MNSDDAIYNFLLEQHFERLSDPIYEEGYLAENRYAPPYPDDNPYPFPEKLCNARMRVASIDRKLTKKEKERLRKLNERIAKTEWERWVTGNYFRYCVERA